MYSLLVLESCIHKDPDLASALVLVFKLKFTIRNVRHRRVKINFEHILFLHVIGTRGGYDNYHWHMMMTLIPSCFCGFFFWQTNKLNEIEFRDSHITKLTYSSYSLLSLV